MRLDRPSAQEARDSRLSAANFRDGRQFLFCGWGAARAMHRAGENRHGPPAQFVRLTAWNDSPQPHNPVSGFRGRNLKPCSTMFLSW